MSVAEKRRFWLVDEDGKPVDGRPGIDGGVPGVNEGPYVKAGTPIETSNPGWIAQLEGKPWITETPPRGAKK
jgi:hypothetical protein